MLTHLYQIVRDRAIRHPTTIAIGSQSGLTWRTVRSRELLDLVDATACRLADLGIREGDRVVVWVPSHWRTPVFLFALWKLGAIVVPFDHEMNPEAAVRIIVSLNARCAIVGYDESPAWARNTRILEWWEPQAETDPHRETTEWTPPSEQLATISFTSGTTGQPKGCMITHANLCSQLEAAFSVIPLDSTCRLASICHFPTSSS
jgi:long-chain acyl-CoA synthetase